MTRAPATLERAGIAARIPHAGPMCLLDAMTSWSDDHIECSTQGHADVHHPLRVGDALPAVCALEFASQAMALHGALCAQGDGPSAGFLASARALCWRVARLDDALAPLRIHAQRLAGGAGQAMYRFELRDGHDRLLVDGRATVVFDRPLVGPSSAP